MEGFLIACLSAFWLGILTSISPCPLATNVAAISFVGKRVDHPYSVLLSGVIYTIGRTITYVVLGILLVSTMLSAPMLSHWLQRNMNMLLGPVLIIVGLFLLEVISFSFGGGFSEKLQKKVQSLGVCGAGLLGILFALSFCPTSAALFFGSLIAIALQQESQAIIPAIYGLATGLPVLLFAVLLATGANRLARAYNRVMLFEKWARRITGSIFIVVGLYYMYVYYAS